MKTKSLSNLSGALSRSQMKAMLAGKPFPPYDCSRECYCKDEREISYYADGSCHCDSGFALPCSTGAGPQ